jgi:hypothetical protein
MLVGLGREGVWWGEGEGGQGPTYRVLVAEPGCQLHWPPALLRCRRSSGTARRRPGPCLAPPAAAVLSFSSRRLSFVAGLLSRPLARPCIPTAARAPPSRRRTLCRAKVGAGSRRLRRGAAASLHGVVVGPPLSASSRVGRAPPAVARHSSIAFGKCTLGVAYRWQCQSAPRRVFVLVVFVSVLFVAAVVAIGYRVLFVIAAAVVIVDYRFVRWRLLSSPTSPRLLSLCLDTRASANFAARLPQCRH